MLVFPQDGSFYKDFFLSSPLFFFHLNIYKQTRQKARYSDNILGVYDLLDNEVPDILSLLQEILKGIKQNDIILDDNQFNNSLAR